VGDDIYKPIELEVKDMNTGELHKAITYVLDDFNQDLLNLTLIESYSSRDHPKYDKVEDTPNNTEFIYNAVKSKQKKTEF
jgi:hypothetical protein